MHAMEIFTYHRNKGSDFPHRSFDFLTLNFLAGDSLADQRKDERRQRIFPGIQVAVIPMTFRLRLLVLFVSSLHSLQRIVRAQLSSHHHQSQGQRTRN